MSPKTNALLNKNCSVLCPGSFPIEQSADNGRTFDVASSNKWTWSAKGSTDTKLILNI